MTIRIATNPIAWTNDDVPGLGGEIPVETCLSEANSAGYSGIEMGGKFPRDADALDALLSTHDLVLASGWWEGQLLEHGADAEFEAMHPYLDMLKQLGVAHFIYGEGSLGRTDGIWKPISQRPRLQDSEWPAYAQELTALADKTAALGIGLALHPHMGTVVETDREVDRLMELAGPSVKLAFDTGHCLFAGGDPVALCQRHAARIAHVHCKDVRSDKLRKAHKRDMSFMDAVLDGIFTVPGDGGVDFPAILGTLKEEGYSGWLVVEAEQNPEKAPPLFHAKLGHDYLLQEASRAGLR
ncbi:myo-inosose-2 dehydratase [Hoeflea prorocentri]|uniref:Myo-inosose-2 dehydratase n=1 Tax=Hoeflea prorocentri TaxID=1922333 RepID=A0A9X3UN82_9HYPH|nr:myo-inosose-2 dehydratase [Hoeflea prorocentri]MCY6382324.1 myo-inosose-2 dehydratase [Hoeflea prorocentri]MDA5400124.1 myo-inosose-2 dehydratase [Hoeflea prorocentri]